MNFNPYDCAILAAYFIGILYLGLHGNKRVKNIIDFLVAGREVNVWVGETTLLATETAVITNYEPWRIWIYFGFRRFYFSSSYRCCYDLVWKSEYKNITEMNKDEEI